MKTIPVVLCVGGHDPTGGAGIQGALEEAHRVLGIAAIEKHRPEIDQIGRVELVTLGPLTNVATALLRDPSLAEKIIRCVIMGGIGFGYGNIIPAAEYNIWVDPDAADIVFESGLPIEMVGWDVSHKHATFTAEEAEELGRRLTRIFLRDSEGRRAVFGASDKLQRDPWFRDHVLFYEHASGNIETDLSSWQQLPEPHQHRFIRDLLGQACLHPDRSHVPGDGK